MNKSRAPEAYPILTEPIASLIYLLRGQKVMFDSDLADIYGVETRALIQAVKRNPDRFPNDFMFQLTQKELENWRSQFVISNPSSKMGLRRPPYAFTEHGVAMLSSVLKSNRAVQMNVLIIRAFVQMRELLATNKDLASRVEKVETTQIRHTSIISLLAEEIERLSEAPPLPPRRRIGFTADDEEPT